MRIPVLWRRAVGLEKEEKVVREKEKVVGEEEVMAEEEADEDEQWVVVNGAGGEVVSAERRNAKRALVGAGGRFLFYPTLFYNVFRNRLEPKFHWWDPIDKFVLLGAVPFISDVPELKKLGVKGVISLTEPFETLVPRAVYQAHEILHLEIPTRDYLFAPSMDDIVKAVKFIDQLASRGASTYVHCKAGRGRSTTVVLCYLIKYKQMTPEEALDLALLKRPGVRLAKAQWKAVQNFSILATMERLSVQSSNVKSGQDSGEPWMPSTPEFKQTCSLKSGEESRFTEGQT